MIVMYVCFFFNDTATTEIYTLSLHDALPICDRHAEADGPLHRVRRPGGRRATGARRGDLGVDTGERRRGEALELVGPLLPRADRKSTRLNSSHANISYAVFCLKKKKIPVCIT